LGCRGAARKELFYIFLIVAGLYCVTARPKKKGRVTSGCAKPHLLKGSPNMPGPHRKMVTQEESATLSEGEGEGVAKGSVTANGF
jgi:hypothetical protein